MKITWKALLALFFYTLGVVGWFYVGGWMILRGPVRGVILAHMAGDLSLIKLAVALVQGFVYLSLAGGVWCIIHSCSAISRSAAVLRLSLK